MPGSLRGSPYSATMMIRALRRLIVKKFGGVRQFLLVSAGILIVLYCIHSLLAGSSYQIWDVNGASLNLTENGALEGTTAGSDTRCGVKCSANQVGFYIRTGEDSVTGPTICFDGEVVISPVLKNYGRGLNVVVINDQTLFVEAVRTFDTYLEDSGLIRFLKKSVPDNFVILMASFDEMSQNLKEDGQRWLKLYGSNQVGEIKFRDGFLMIGQKGLKEGHAIEYLSRKTKHQEFARVIEKAGCFSLPLGPRQNLQLLLPEVVSGDRMVVGPEVPNCGLPSPCPADSVSASVFTGQGNTKGPQICVDGHVMMAEELNNGGRGFNIIIIDPDTRKPTSITHVDTYTYDSTDLEIFLENLEEGEIIIAAVADDAAKKLSYAARELLNGLGSGLIQNVRFRDAWFFVGQKGIKGFTDMEQISYVGFEGEWPKPLQQSMCIPKKINGRAIVPDPGVYRNDMRREFCKKYEGYMELCDPSRVDEKLEAAENVNQALNGHHIFSTPLIIVPGLDHNALVRTMQTTLMQPGVNPAMVAVMWDEKFPEHAHLADLFGFSNASVQGSINYTDHMVKAVAKAGELFPGAEHLMVMEEELLLAPDFLPFMARCLDILKSDPSLLGVSAWNFNGFESSSGNRGLVYRVEEFPGVGFLMKTPLLTQLLPAHGPACCQQRAWHGWKLQSLTAVAPDVKEMLVPDMSRVYRQPYQGADTDAELVRALFHRPRTVNLEADPGLQGLTNLTATAYEAFLHDELSRGVPLGIKLLRKCVSEGKPVALSYPADSGLSLVVYYKQNGLSDFTALRQLCRCFGLFSAKNHRPKNLHKGLLRFFYQGHNIYLVGSSSDYMQHKPANSTIFTPVSDLG